MPRKLRITRNQIEKATSQISSLSRIYDNPMARFHTDQDGWIIEVEHLEQNGSDRLKNLGAAAKQVGNEFELTVSRRTGSKNRKQYHLAEISNGTYAVQVRVRDRDAENYFKR